VRYADELVLLAKEETILQSMIDKLIEVGREYGMEINVGKTKTMRISRQPTPLQIKIDKNPVENAEDFNYLGSMITNDARCGMPCCAVWHKFACILEEHTASNFKVTDMLSKQ
jgi:hypothetical protein